MKRNPKSETRYPNSLWRATNRNPLSPICNLQSAIGHRQFLVLFLLLTLPALASAQVAASLLAQRARYYESIGPGDKNMTARTSQHSAGWLITSSSRIPWMTRTM